MSRYTEEQIQESIEGWTMFDAAWKCFKFINKNIKGTRVLDLGCGPKIMCNMITLFNRGILVEGLENLGDRNHDYYDTIYTSNVLEHVPDYEAIGIVQTCFNMANKRCIHIVPLGDVEDKNIGTPHVQVYNRKSFKEQVKYALRKEGCEISDYGIIEDIHMSSLYIVIDKI